MQNFIITFIFTLSLYGCIENIVCNINKLKNSKDKALNKLIIIVNAYITYLIVLGLIKYSKEIYLYIK